MDNCFHNALDTVSREKCERGFWISDKDETNFYKGLKIVKSRESASEKTVTHVKNRVFENTTDEPRVFPYTSCGYENMEYQEIFVGDVQGRANVGVNRSEVGIGVQCGGLTARRGEQGQEWERKHLNLPPHTKLEESHNRCTTVSYDTYACQADFSIRVYPRKYVKNGAAAGGGIGGVAGIGGGAAAGAAIGVAVGTVVPIAGNIIGGVVGGIIGSLVGLLGGGAIGSASGAGVGGAVSNDNYVKVTAREIFKKLPNFSVRENMVYCEISKSTVSEGVTATYSDLN